ncbi:CAF17-like 4Fe-4S cluster assembly/insertion protein YgfZ [Dongia rigui]|uniref:Folate-binding protein n=1 Tax=Dongia rigui TaxID=940149 RepID=A0ABU5E1N3_9PROT|nr:folate-binding protein [Dongia rigui]MDY0872731.1 folate-binding protein [Dongia rigui]
MEDKAFFELNPARSMIAIGGQDRAEFLQGLISNDTKRIGPAQAVFAALLSPQGKFAYDLLLVEEGARYLVDCESARRADLLKRLKMFKLRSQVTLDDLDSEFVVVNLFGGGALARIGLAAHAGAAKALGGGVVFTDPRLPDLGVHAFLPRATYGATLSDLGFAEAPQGSFKDHRYALGVPEGSHDLLPDKAIPLECGFDELNGVDWQKGCYMGQELTARTKYRGLVRKRLLPVRFEGNPPPIGTDLTLDGKDVGDIRAVDGYRGLALLRLEYLDAILANGIDVDGTRVTASIPNWVKLPAVA